MRYMGYIGYEVYEWYIEYEVHGVHRLSGTWGIGYLELKQLKLFENSADVKKWIFKVTFNILKITPQEFPRLVSSTAQIACNRLGCCFLHDYEMQPLQGDLVG